MFIKVIIHMFMTISESTYRRRSPTLCQYLNLQTMKDLVEYHLRSRNRLNVCLLEISIRRSADVGSNKIIFLILFST